jgi:hypothetical protein
MGVPPPVLMQCRVHEYAILNRQVAFAGHTNVFVGNKELGRVPGLAIGESLESGKWALFYCGRKWSVRAWIDVYSSIRRAKLRAERTYPGVKARWKKTGVSKARARRYLKAMWKGLECSFCGRTPPKFNRSVVKGKVGICDLCVEEFHEAFGAPQGDAA